MSFPSMFDILALIGVLALTFVVGKYGFIPVYNRVRGWFSTGVTSLALLEARVKALETGALMITPVPPTVMPITPPIVKPII